MGLPARESLESGFDAPQELVVQAEDLVFNALQAGLAEGERLRHYEPLWRKDYVGDPSVKEYVGGALLLEFTVFAANQFTKHEAEVDESMFHEDIRSQLEKRAKVNWHLGRGWIRDQGRNL
jgi:hypothetical protein